MKFVKWFGKLLITTVLISSISIATSWYMVSLYVEEIFRQYQIPALGKKFQFSEFASRLAEELNIVKPRDGGKQADTAQKGETAPGGLQPQPAPSPGGSVSSASESANEGVSGAAGAVPSPDNSAGAATESDDDAVAVMGRVQSGDTSNKQDLVMSTEEFAQKKEKLTNEDKMKIFSLVIGKLPQDEVQRLSLLLEDGITTEELKEVDQTLQTYLSQDEYKQLLAIIGKY